MPIRFRPGDHYCLGKLQDELLPWMISARQVGRQYFVWLAAVSGYVGDFAAALAGLGIGARFNALLQGKVANNQNALDVLRTVLARRMYVAGVIGCSSGPRCAWSQHQDMLTRALLAREYARGIDALGYAQLYQAIAEAGTDARHCRDFRSRSITGCSTPSRTTYGPGHRRFRRGRDRRRAECHGRPHPHHLYG